MLSSNVTFKQLGIPHNCGILGSNNRTVTSLHIPITMPLDYCCLDHMSLFSPLGDPLVTIVGMLQSEHLFNG